MEISLRKLFRQGGPGSGHRGHRGRKGQIGGSLPEKFGARSSYAPEEFNYFIMPNGNIVPVDPDETHATTIRKTPEKLGFGKEETEEVSAFTLHDFLVKKKVIRIKGYQGSKNELAIDLPGPLDIGALQDMYYAGQFPKLPDEARVTIGWQDKDKGYLEMEGTLGELLTASGIKLHPDKYYVFKNRSLFRMGGPGSGFRGHRGRPGQVGGSSKDGTVSAIDPEQLEKMRQRFKEHLREPKEDQEARQRKRVEDIAKKLGYPPEKIWSTTANGHTFTVGNKSYQAGADFNPQTGLIRVFSVGDKTDLQLEGVLAHEIQHARWRSYQVNYQKQFVEVRKSLNSNDESQWLIRMDGSLKNKSDVDRLWAYDIQESFMTPSSKRWARLKKTDGISAYSKSYWAHANLTGSAYDYDRAVDETLAEIARIKVGAARQGDKKGIRPIWQSLFNKVHRGTSVTRNQLLFLFGGPGSGFHGHEGRPGLVGGSSSTGSTYREFSHNRSGDTMIWGKQLFDESGLTEEEVAALKDYKSSSFVLNDWLRYGRGNNSNEDKAIAIDQTISKSALPENVLAFRGINRNSIGPDTGDYTGVEFTDKGFVSTTLHIKSALGWSWNNQDPIGTVVQIRLTKGSPAMFMDEIYDRGEYELLLPRNMKFRVVKDETVDRFDAPDPWRLLTVEVIS